MRIIICSCVNGRIPMNENELVFLAFLQLSLVLARLDQNQEVAFSRHLFKNKRPYMYEQKSTQPA